jgi:hypothetical protein
MRRDLHPFNPPPPASIDLPSFFAVVDQFTSAVDDQLTDRTIESITSIIIILQSVDTIDFEAGDGIASTDVFDRIIRCLQDPMSPVFEPCLRLIAALCHTCGDFVSEIVDRELIGPLFDMFLGQSENVLHVEGFFYVFSELCEDRPETRDDLLRLGIIESVVRHLRESDNLFVYKAALKCASSCFTVPLEPGHEPPLQLDPAKMTMLFETLRWFAPVVLFNEEPEIRTALGCHIWALLMNDEVYHANFEWPICAEFPQFFLQTLFGERAVYLVKTKGWLSEAFEFLRYVFIGADGEWLMEILQQFNIMKLACVVQRPSPEEVAPDELLWQVMSIASTRHTERIVACVCAIFKRCMELDAGVAIALNERHFFQTLIELGESASLSLKREIALIASVALVVLGPSDLEDLLVVPLVELFQCGEWTDWADQRPFTRTIKAGIYRMAELLPEDSEVREALNEAGLLDES